jgi:hypothetical protein
MGFTVLEEHLPITMKATADAIFNLVAALVADGSARRPICSRQTPKQKKDYVSCNVS